MPDFLSLTTTDLLGQIILCYGELSCDYTMLINISDLYHLDNSSTSTLPSQPKGPLDMINASLYTKD